MGWMHLKCFNVAHVRHGPLCACCSAATLYACEAPAYETYGIWEQGGLLVPQVSAGLRH